MVLKPMTPFQRLRIAGVFGLLAFAGVFVAPAVQPGPGIAGDGRLGALLDSIRSDQGAPARGALLLVGDSVLEVAAVGHRVDGHDELVTDADLWHLGSNTKAMTATLAGILVERGDIEWTTTIQDVFPELADSIRAEYRDVQLRELLSHTAGLMADASRTPSWLRLRTDTASVHQQRVQWAREFMSVPREVPRGTFLYSNAGYVIAGAMLEQVTGENWETLMQRELFRPLGMTGAGFGPPGDPGSRDQPWGHIGGSASTLRAVPPGPFADNPAALGPAGTVHASLRDYARFVAAHLAGARGVDGIVSAKTFATLHQPVDSAAGYALGWGVTDRPWARGTVLTHNGSNTLWFATVWIAPARNFAVIATANVGGERGARATDQAASLLIRRYDAWERRE
jgi:CubicO group peptidase (beta-lactamase class C family)